MRLVIRHTLYDSARLRASIPPCPKPNTKILRRGYPQVSIKGWTTCSRILLTLLANPVSMSMPPFCESRSTSSPQCQAPSFEASAKMVGTGEKPRREMHVVSGRLILVPRVLNGRCVSPKPWSRMRTFCAVAAVIAGEDMAKDRNGSLGKSLSCGPRIDMMRRLDCPGIVKRKADTQPSQTALSECEAVENARTEYIRERNYVIYKAKVCLNVSIMFSRSGAV